MPTLPLRMVDNNGFKQDVSRSHFIQLTNTNANGFSFLWEMEKGSEA